MRYLLLLLTIAVFTGCATKESRCEKAIKKQSEILLSKLPKVVQDKMKPGKKKLAKRVKECVTDFDGKFVDCIAKAKDNGDLAACTADKIKRKVGKKGSEAAKKIEKRAKEAAKRKVNKAIDEAGGK